MQEKITIVINGVGGCGKDTLVKFTSKYFWVKNVSSITPIKNIASVIGWDGSKDEKSRKFLSDLKKLTTDYNDYTLNYLLREQKDFLSSPEEIMFVHIREPEEIAKFVSNSLLKTYTLLVRPREELKGKYYGNKSDDEVENYNYDFVFDNSKSIEESKKSWLEFFRKNIKKESYIHPNKDLL
ncbi:MAG: hypothetical protein IKA36_04230 [Clostridia bacterium]|nr:hypothetical protein [Clostridia bacterium]